MIQHLRSNSGSSADQRDRIALWEKLNRLDLERRGPDMQLEGRIESMEVAYRMQSEAMDAFDLTNEPAAVHARYGTIAAGDRSEMKIKSATRDGDFARGCLLARRLVERGVR